jgi:hypothetical protein
MRKDRVAAELAEPKLLDQIASVPGDHLLVPIVDARHPLHAIAAAGQLDLLAEHFELRPVQVVDERVRLLSQSM